MDREGVALWRVKGFASRDRVSGDLLLEAQGEDCHVKGQSVGIITELLFTGDRFYSKFESARQISSMSARSWGREAAFFAINSSSFPRK